MSNPAPPSDPPATPSQDPKPSNAGRLIVLVAVLVAMFITCPSKTELQSKMISDGWILAKTDGVTQLGILSFCKVTSVSGASAIYLGLFGRWFEISLGK